METRTVVLRLVVGSRDFDKRRVRLANAMEDAMSTAASVLYGAGFRVIERRAEIINEGGEGQ